MHVRNTYAGCKSTAQICYKSHCKRVHVFHSMATDEQPRIMIITHGELSSAQSRPDVPSTTSLAALGEEQASSDSQLLLPKLYTVPTASRKLHGLKDIMLLLAALIPYLLMKVFRFLMSRLGVSEHRWKGVPNDLPMSRAGRERLQEIVAMLRSGALNKVVLLSSPSNDLQQQFGPAAAAVMRHLYEVITAMETVAAEFKLQLDEERTAVYSHFAKALQVLAMRESVNPQDVLKSLRHDGKVVLKQLCKHSPPFNARRQDVLKAYVFQCLMQHSLGVAPHQQRALAELGDGRELQEVASLLPTDAGLEFLRAQGTSWSEHIQFMSDFPNMRPSDAKKEWVVQAMSINARVHRLMVKGKDGRPVEVASVLRSGAYAVHGRKPRGIGLSGLMSLQQAAQSASGEEERASLLGKAKVRSLAALEPEIRIRSVCCIAQALPVVVAALKQACRSRVCLESALRSGAFLFVQQSLLSDLNANERSYLQDTRGALDLLSEQLSIRFTFQPQRQVEVNPATGHILLTLDRDLVPESALPEGLGHRDELLARTYRLHAVVFSQGINVLQSLGFFTVSDSEEITQDTMNREGVERLNAYAAQAGRTGCKSLQALNQHYMRGQYRSPKDVESVALVRKATAELGGLRAVNCKSGKDRTALEVANSMPAEAVAAGVLPASQLWSVRAALQEGLSYTMTGENNGQPNAYAFSELELVCLPPGWRPRWRLCGKVMS